MIQSRPQVDAVILDLDDTLIRERDYVSSGYEAVAKTLEGLLDTPARTLVCRLEAIFDSPDRARAFDAVLAPFGREDLVAQCVETYRSHKPNVELKASAQVLLEQLSGVVALGVVTDGPLVMQEAKVAALQLRERGLKVVCTDSLGGRDAWKPSPIGLIEVFRQLEVRPDRAVYVADNPHKDFLAASRAGTHSVRLQEKGQLHVDCAAPAGGEPEFVVQDLLSILDFVQI
ncbi:HAD family hydrolase [Blastococcus sp. Marseille-P5729]|uniref:HAD family hydrolase n=1 Tax=Blastococcus sp. Marseille-P5729 TaxID=2086582 RepID=UPI000D0FE4AB|nr:HAD family hydrolase [Blastococcus sp. Marseille-P5729]